MTLADSALKTGGAEKQAAESDLRALIARRTAWLQLQLKKDTLDDATKESVTTQIWFLNDQKDQIPDMMLDDLVQLTQMIEMDSKGQEEEMRRELEEAVPATPQSPLPSGNTATLAGSSPTSVATAPSQTESEKASPESESEPEPILSEDLEEPDEDFASAPVSKTNAASVIVTTDSEPMFGGSDDYDDGRFEDDSVTTTSTDEGESVYAMLASAIPVAQKPSLAKTSSYKEEPLDMLGLPVSTPSAPATPQRSSLRTASSSEDPKKTVKMSPLSTGPILKSTSLKHNRSDSFSNLDELDTLLAGGEIDKVEEDILAWSSTAPHNLSDWKICVENESDSTKVTYFVHKLVLSTGPTRSEHFERRFGKEENLENGLTEVTLSESAANALPQLLDFLYSREDGLLLTPKNALGLRHLGKLWGIRKLVVLATKYIRDQAKPETSLHYLNSAAEFQDEVVMSLAAEICAGSILEVDRQVLTALEPPLFSMVVSCEKVACSSAELSQIVGEFCRLNEDYMNQELLHVVTASNKMPEIHCSESVYLLSLSEQHETDAATKSDLESRCIKSASLAWSTTLVNQLRQKDKVPVPYDDISFELKVKLLEEALLKGRDDLNSAGGKHQAIIDEYAAKEDAAKVAQEAELSAMKNKLKKAQSHRKELEQELKSFQRVPWDFKTPKLKIGTYEPNKKGCGKTKPSAAPSTATSEEDLFGCILPEGKNAWPLYYFKK